MENHTKLFWFASLMDPQPLRVLFDKIDGLDRNYDQDIWHYLKLKNMISFEKGSDILYEPKELLPMPFVIIMQK